MLNSITSVLQAVWAFLTSSSVIPVISFVAGGILTLLLPWNKWFIENKKIKQAYRKEKIAQWRKMMHEISNGKDNPNKSVSYLLERHEAYYSLRPHLTHNTIMEIARTRTFISGSTIDASLSFIINEIARLEKEWELI
jgi:hypothetical protein